MSHDPHDPSIRVGHDRDAVTFGDRHLAVYQHVLQLPVARGRRLQPVARTPVPDGQPSGRSLFRHERRIPVRSGRTFGRKTHLCGHQRPDFRDGHLARDRQDRYSTEIRGDEIEPQELANIVFDFQVNAGGTASKLLQRVLNDLGASPPLEVDGDIGPGTLTALKRADAKAVYRAYKKGCLDYYQDLVARRPALGKFLNGWLKRVNSFPEL
mgnify:CR=1 FL=1